MKKIFKTLLISSIALGSLSGCRDAIDIIQDGELNNEATFINTEDVRKFLLGSVYTNFDISNEITFTAQFTDETGQGRANSELAQGPHQFYIDPTTGAASNIWITHYRTINRVNRLLEGAKLVTPANATETASYNSSLAEARAIRAFCYLSLLTYYSTNMKDAEALGVMLIDYVPKNTDVLPRVKNAEIFALIDSDIAYAEANLKDAGDYLYINKNFINAFKARYYLYRGNYPLAKQFATKVINESGVQLTETAVMPTGTPGTLAWHTALNSYSSTSAYIKMWNDKEKGEVLFALSRPVSGSWGNIGSFFNTNESKISGSVLYDMSRNLFNVLQSKPGDIRRYAYIDPTSVIDPNYATNANYKNDDVLVVDKYPGKYSGTQPIRNDLKVFRLSEMYFILAEAAVSENNFSLAADYIKKVRDARNYAGPVAKPVYANATEAWADVLLERRLDLAFEGHRYIDIKRLGKLANKTIERDKTDDLSTTPISIANDDYRFTLPIPKNEIQGNPTIVQNPGY